LSDRRSTLAEAARPSGAAKTGPESAKRQARIEFAREPESDFTAVEASETIQDVAVRVYGSADRADALWRANRDSLPSRDTPLSAGIVLRTPIIR
jgi:hypothetical protein